MVVNKNVACLAADRPLYGSSESLSLQFQRVASCHFGVTRMDKAARRRKLGKMDLVMGSEGVISATPGTYLLRQYHCTIRTEDGLG